MTSKTDKRRFRRPARRGASMRRILAAALLVLLEGRVWRQHPAPFGKTAAGRARREERRFIRNQDMAVFS